MRRMPLAGRLALLTSPSTTSEPLPTPLGRRAPAPKQTKNSLAAASLNGNVNDSRTRSATGSSKTSDSGTTTAGECSPSSQAALWCPQGAVG